MGPAVQFVAGTVLNSEGHGWARGGGGAFIKNSRKQRLGFLNFFPPFCYACNWTENI
jgi:hypothetical protein